MYFVPGDKNRNGNASSGSRKKSKKRLPILWAAIFLLVCYTLVWVYQKYYHPDLETRVHPNAKTHPRQIDLRLLQSKDFGLPEIHPKDEIVRHYAYTLSFDDKDKEAYWVAYTFKKGYLNGQMKRTNHFEADPDVPNGSANPDDYRHSGYDKGHLAPAADMKWDETAMRESFYLSNVCPQDHKCNEGIWAELEKAVRSWTIDDSIEYIVTGPIMPASGQPKIGEDHVTVPAYFYKVIFSPFPYPKAIGFIIPNQPGKVSFWHYACSVNAVEKSTGILFFAKMPSDISKVIKDAYDIEDWKNPDSFNNR